MLPHTPQGHSTKFQQERNAFSAWATELFESAKHGTYASCVEKASAGYSDNATLSIEKDGQILSTVMGSQQIGSKLCDVFKSVRTGDHPLENVKYCNGVWRGSFAPFVDAHKNALGLDPTVAQTVSRQFEIKGHLDPQGRFIADDDKTCIGKCTPRFEWACPSSGW